MSFSVKAKEFVPSPTASPWSATRGNGAADSSNSSMNSGAAAVPQPQLQKERVCMAFYECGECPFGDSCAHAHHFTELFADAQATLLATVSFESIPHHFMSPAPSPSSACRWDRWAANGNISSCNAPPFSPHLRTRVASPRGADGAPVEASNGRRFPSMNGSANGRSLHHGARRALAADAHAGAAALGPSAFDAASTSSCESSSNHRSSKPSSPMLPLDGFKMHLPARCRYPHKSMPGTYYSFLGVPRTATQEEIIGKYRLWQREAFRRMRAVDPAGAEAADRVIVEARNVLGNPTLRAEYDSSLAAAAKAAKAAGNAVSNAARMGAKWASTLSQIQSTTPANTTHPNNVSSSAGTSISLHGRPHHGHSLSSSVSSVASASGSASAQPGLDARGSGTSLHDRLSPVPTVTADMFSDTMW